MDTFFALSGTVEFDGKNYKIKDCGIKSDVPYVVLEPECEELGNLIVEHIRENGCPSINMSSFGWKLILQGKEYPYL